MVWLASLSCFKNVGICIWCSYHGHTDNFCCAIVMRTLICMQIGTCTKTCASQTCTALLFIDKSSNELFEHHLVFLDEEVFRVDHHQIAPTGTVWSGSKLFASYCFVCLKPVILVFTRCCKDTLYMPSTLFWGYAQLRTTCLFIQIKLLAKQLLFLDIYTNNCQCAILFHFF